MLTIKAFDKGLVCRGFQYEVGKTYEMPREKVKICASGFHASAHCDISDTTFYYPSGSEYCLVDINVVDEEEDKIVGNKIKIIKKLSFDECIEYDKTGWWCYRFAQDADGADKEKLQDAVIRKDKTGYWCYEFARDVEGADIDRLQEVVIEKDATGKICYEFAQNIKGADIKRLQEAVIEKDDGGWWCYKFAIDIKGADEDKLQEAVIEKDDEGW